MRRPFLAGNWKMNLDRDAARDLARGLAESLSDLSDRDCAIFPTAVSLADAAEACAGSAVSVGAQNLYPASQGAFTGELSGDILKSVGATHVLCGHSERRQLCGESDAVVNAKLGAALREGLSPILCVGETLEEREAGATEEVVGRQIEAGLSGFDAAALGELTVAYEPVWAIGTGKTATPETAQTVHAHIREQVAELLGSEFAAKLRIQYGGSVKPNNVDELMAMPDIDGALVGGASLELESFLRIVRFESA